MEGPIPMNECRICDRPSFYGICGRCADNEEREAKAYARAEEYDDD